MGHCSQCGRAPGFRHMSTPITRHTQQSGQVVHTRHRSNPEAYSVIYLINECSINSRPETKSNNGRIADLLSWRCTQMDTMMRVCEAK